MTASKKRLIINADDFGQSSGINAGVIAAHQSGPVTSASLMVRWPAAAEAVAYTRNQRALSLGLHVDLGEWIFDNGNWVGRYEVVPLDDVNSLKKEVARQLETFHALVGRQPTHMDSHQHVHLREPARTVFLNAATNLNIPLRHFSSVVRYCGDFYGQTAQGFPLPDAISMSSLISILRTLPYGTTELGCHPGEANDLETMYGAERAQELNTLLDPQLPTMINSLGIELCSFADLPES